MRTTFTLWIPVLLAGIAVQISCNTNSETRDSNRALHPSIEFMENGSAIVIKSAGEPETVWEPGYAQSRTFGFAELDENAEDSFTSRISYIRRIGEGLVFTDQDRMQVIYMSPDSTFSSVGRSGPGPGEYSMPGAIAYAGEGR